MSITGVPVIPISVPMKLHVVVSPGGATSSAQGTGVTLEAASAKLTCQSVPGDFWSASKA